MAERQAAIALLLSALGGVVCVDGRGDELILTGIADGTAKAGHAVFLDSTIGATEGDLIGVKVDDNVDTFAGILLPKYNTDCDTAVTNGDIVEYVVPKSGRRYNVAITDPGAATSEAGDPITLAAGTAGQFHTSATTIETKDYWGFITKGVANTSRFCEMVWA